MLDSGILNRLEAKYPNLAAVFKENWQTPLIHYSASFYDKKPTNLEPELKEAFREEWALYGKSDGEISHLIEELENSPVLQTSHHVTPTNGPTFLAYDLISLAGLKNDRTYLVAANSGVAFSNPAWSGALSYGQLPLDWLLLKNTKAYGQAERSAKDREKDGKTDERISLIPAKMRDGLVYGTRISDFQLSRFSQFSDKLKEISVPMVTDGVYSIWASRLCGNIQSAVFKGGDIFYFDINRILSKYIIRILLSKREHPLVEMLFSDQTNTRINEQFEKPVFFQGTYPGKKSFKVEGYGWQSNSLIGARNGAKSYNRQQLIEGLQQDKLCPGIFLQFFILRFLNGLRCLGSFNQIEYLEDFRKRWLQLDCGWDLHTESDSGQSLTTGRLIHEGQAVWPLDLALKNDTIDLQEYSNKEMSHFWEPVVKQLV